MRSGVNDPTEQAVLGEGVMSFKERRALLLNQKQADEAPTPSTTAKDECNLTPGDMTARAAQLQAALDTSLRAAGAAGAAGAAAEPEEETETHA